MKIVLQKVSKASVSVEEVLVGSIDRGYLVFVCVMQGDTPAQMAAAADKIANLRLFDGKDGKINDLSLLQAGGQVLVISQFTLAGDVHRGSRPDYTAAEKPDAAKQLYEHFIASLETAGIPVEQGTFGAHMRVESINDGPVTLILT